MSAAARQPSGEKTVPRQCGHCVHFSNAPADIEAAFPGLSVMSSAHASVRGQDGLCARHGLYLPYRDCCADFSPAESSR